MRFFAAALIFFGVAASYAQTPQVPHKIHFAGMSLTIRDDAKREIQKDVDALTKHSRYFNIKVERARTYFPIIEKILKEEQVPDDIKYLALQESSLVPDAVSVSNAVGFWQFKDFTAQEMGMRVDDEIDERMNIVSATRGAARYLKQNNTYFNNWVLAVQAYQMGAGGVKRSVGDTYNGDSHMEISAETYWYVKKFLAHKIAFESSCTGSAQLTVALLESKDKTRLNDIANKISVDENALREYNKWIKRGTIPSDKSYMVIIPGGSIPQDFSTLAMSSEKASKAIALKRNAVEMEKKQINGVEAIKALHGETITSLAVRGKVNISKFISYNDIAIDDQVRPGMFYFIKKKKKKSTHAPYRAKMGDDLWMVSQQQGIRLNQLKKLNPEINDRLLSVGTVVRLNANEATQSISVDDPGEVAELANETFAWAAKPLEEAKTMNEPAQTLEASDEMRILPDSTEVIKSVTQKTDSIVIYEVKPSDTLYGIARQFGATIKDVMEWNNKSTLTISPGEKLKILKR